MKKHEILTTCYSPFGGQKKEGAAMREDPRVIELAQKAGMGVGGLLQSWAVERNCIPLGKSQSEGLLSVAFINDNQMLTRGRTNQGKRRHQEVLPRDHRSTQCAGYGRRRGAYVRYIERHYVGIEIVPELIRFQPNHRSGGPTQYLNPRPSSTVSSSRLPTRSAP